MQAVHVLIMYDPFIFIKINPLKTFIQQYWTYFSCFLYLKELHFFFFFKNYIFK